MECYCDGHILGRISVIGLLREGVEDCGVVDLVWRIPFGHVNHGNGRS